jgi:hypothetical protein
LGDFLGARRVAVVAADALADVRRLRVALGVVAVPATVSIAGWAAVAFVARARVEGFLAAAASVVVLLAVRRRVLVARPGPVAAAVDRVVEGAAAATRALEDAALRRGALTVESSDLASFLAARPAFGVDDCVVSSILAADAVAWIDAIAFWAARLVEYAPLDDRTRPWDISRNLN